MSRVSTEKMTKPLSKRNQKRLLKLADFIYNMPEERRSHFHMRAWFSHFGDHELSSEVIDEKTLADCGTACCALGWATLVPEFKDEGIRLTVTNQFREGRERISSFEASRKLFGLSIDRHIVLFEEWNYPASDHKAWAAKCRRLVKAWS